MSQQELITKPTASELNVKRGSEEESKVSTSASEVTKQIGEHRTDIPVGSVQRNLSGQQTVSTMDTADTKKKNPFRFFEDPEGYEEDRKKQVQSGISDPSATLIPTAFGERVDFSDLKKEKYLAPTKRRKMSFSDFEKRVEEGNLTLLDLLVNCAKDITILEYLEDQLRHVFEITKTFEDGRGFLFYAISRRFYSVIVKLLEMNQALVHQVDLWGRQPLHYASQTGDFEIVKTLVSKGASIDVPDLELNTALHMAMMFGKGEVAVFLISNGASKNHENRYGIKPIDYLGREFYKMFEGLGLINGESGMPMVDDIKIDSGYKRRFDILTRTRKLRPGANKTQFSDCYTERDKGRGYKPFGGGDMQRQLSANDSPAEPAEPSDQKRIQDSSKTVPIELGSPTELASPLKPKSNELGLTLEPVNSPDDKTEKVTHRSFMLYDVIGSGSFGEVYLVTSKIDGKLYAMKVYSKHKIVRNGLLKFLFLEKRILINFDHPFIIKVHHAFQTLRKLYLVMDYCRFRDLGQYLTKFEKIPEYQARIMIAEVVLAVEELHKRNVIHRDLKPDNILIDEDGHIKITDFGLSKDEMPPKKLTSTFCGSVAYLPPEVVTRSGHNQSADWYLVGELLYESIFGVPPFFNASKKVLLNSIVQDQVQFPSYINRATKDFILRLMEKDPKKRLGCNGKADQIKAHPFFTGVDWEVVYNKRTKLFDTKDITPYQCQNFNQEIVDKSDTKNQLHKIVNWSVSR